MLNQVCFNESCNDASCSNPLGCQPALLVSNPLGCQFCLDENCINESCMKNDIINKKIQQRKCQNENCNKYASCNFEGETQIPIYCAEHKLENMINVKKKRKCQHENCNKRPSFNYEGENKPIYCAEHKLENMIDIKNKKCQHENCKIIPNFNYEGENKPLYCLEHKQSKMIDIKNKKCIECNDTQISNSKYKNHCARCFIYKFPDEPITRNYKIKEQHVVDFIKENFKNLSLIFNRQIQGGCSRRLPDVFIDLFTHSIIIECDEDQHRNYHCDNKRTMELFQDLGNRPIVFIRFNPDSYIDKNNNKIDSCFNYHKITGVPIIANKKLWNQRLKTLKSKIQYYINNIPEKEVTIEKLYYNLI